MCCPGFLCDLLISSAAAFRRPWTPRTRWMSFWGEPSMPGASTSWEKTTLRSSCSPSRHPAWRKRFRQRPATIRWASASNLIDYMEAGSSWWPSSSVLSCLSIPRRWMIVLEVMLPALSWYSASYHSYRLLSSHSEYSPHSAGASSQSFGMICTCDKCFFFDTCTFDT